MRDGQSSSEHMVLLNGSIFNSPSDCTASPSFSSCMVIRNKHIQYIGGEHDAPVLASKQEGAVIKDLEGRTVLPGFIDGHLHILLVGQALSKVDLGHCETLDDIRHEIGSYAASHPEAPRIFCKGWMYSATPGGVDASMLDDVDATRPIFVDAKDLHSSWCNSAGLRDVYEVMGIGDDTPDPAGGAIQRDASGRPNGVFHEGAVFEIMWPFLARCASIQDRKDAISAAFRAFSAAGYTGVTDMAMDETIWEPLTALRSETGTLRGMRLAAYWLMKPTGSPDEAVAQVDRAASLAARWNAERTPDCRVVGIKIICDGIVDACTASLAEPYSRGGANPDPLWSRDVLHALVARAHAAGLQVALHAIGDRTIQTAVDVLESSTDSSRRPRIEHLELASARDARRLGALGITASIQPVHSDPAILKAWPDLIGPARCQRAFAYRDFADAGAPLALGSDAPTAPHEPLPNLYVATTRRSSRDPDLETVVNPAFALTLCQALAGATHGSAYSTFADHWTGSLKPGLKADFVVCRVILTPEQLLDGRVDETWFEGELVYARRQ